MDDWNGLKKGERIEIGLVQVDIAGHSKLQASDKSLKEAKGIFRAQMEGIAKSRGGRLFNWAGDGGAFMFRTGTGEGYHSLGFSALQMLNSMPAINEEVNIRTDLNADLHVRISCDSGVVAFDDDPGEITADFINRFLKHERSLGITDAVSVTERVWKQLPAKLRSRFHTYKYSPEVENLIYNCGGKERQRDVLQSLRNVIQVDGVEKAAEEAECVEILAFRGDTLLDLSKHAYGDVRISNHENVGGLNLLVTKNAELCWRHWEPEERERRLASLERLPSGAIDPLTKLEGGESLWFYNCAALGYVPAVGDGNLARSCFRRTSQYYSCARGCTRTFSYRR